MLNSAMKSSAHSTAAQYWRILYADDVRELRLLMEQILACDGHTVKCVEDGVQAWAELKKMKFAYDVVITDHNMPRMNGLELVQQLRATGYPGKIIVVSSDLSEAVDQTYHNLNVDRVFKKPFQFARLRDLVKELQQATV